MAPKDSRWSTEQLAILFEMEKGRVQALIDVIRAESAAKIALQRDETVNFEEARVKLMVRLEKMEQKLNQVKKDLLELKEKTDGKMMGFMGVEREIMGPVVFTAGGGSDREKLGGGGSVTKLSGGNGEEEWLDVESGEDNDKKIPRKATR